MQNFRIWMNQNTKYCTQTLTFFRLLNTIIGHQKLLIKNKRVFCLFMKVAISRYFHAFLGLKNLQQRKLATLQEVGEKKISEFKVSEVVTSFSISSPGSLVFTIVLITVRVFFVVNNIGQAREPGRLSYHLVGNS